MITVTRLNGTKFVLNSDLVEIMEETPDTIITLTNGNRYVVTESTQVLVQLITDFRRSYHLNDSLVKGGQ